MSVAVMGNASPRAEAPVYVDGVDAHGLRGGLSRPRSAVVGRGRVPGSIRLGEVGADLHSFFGAEGSADPAIFPIRALGLHQGGPVV